MIKKSSAHLISFLINPVFATAVTLLVALEATSTDKRQFWLALIIVLNLLTPIVLVSFLMKQGFAIDDTLENSRVKRERLYAIGPLVLIGLLQWWLASQQQVGQPFVAAVAATTLLTAVMAMISYSWKISHHLTNVSALVLVVGLIYGVTSLWLAIILPVVAWARLKLYRHTARQLVGGALLAPAVMLPVFYLYNLL